MTFEIQDCGCQIGLEIPRARLAAKVFRKAERKSAKLFAEAIKSRVPVELGLFHNTIKVRSSKGPRGSGTVCVSIAVLVGQGGAGKDKAKQEAEEKAKIAFYAFMQERGFTVGKRRRATLLGISAQWHTRAAGNLGSQGVSISPASTSSAMRHACPGRTSQGNSRPRDPRGHRNRGRQILNEREVYILPLLDG